MKRAGVLAVTRGLSEWSSGLSIFSLLLLFASWSSKKLAYKP